MSETLFQVWWTNPQFPEIVYFSYPIYKPKRFQPWTWDPPITSKNLEIVKISYITVELRKLHEEWPLWKPVVLINCGVARDFSYEPSMMMLKPTSSTGAGYLSSDCWVIRIFNYCPNCAPEGRTLLYFKIAQAEGIEHYMLMKE